MFRHSYGTHLLQQNVSPAKVMQLLGHSTMEMVMQVYN
jgi:integrase